MPLRCRAFETRQAHDARLVAFYLSVTLAILSHLPVCQVDYVRHLLHFGLTTMSNRERPEDYGATSSIVNNRRKPSSQCQDKYSSGYLQRVIWRCPHGRSSHGGGNSSVSSGVIAVLGLSSCVLVRKRYPETDGDLDNGQSNRVTIGYPTKWWTPQVRAFLMQARAIKPISRAAQNMTRMERRARTEASASESLSVAIPKRGSHE
jgi:hypothetical protein